MDRSRPQLGTRALGINPDEPFTGRSQTSDPAYAMPEQTGPGSRVLQRVVDDARKAALKGPNPHEHIKGTWHSMASFRTHGDFDGQGRRSYTIFAAPGIFKVL